MESKIVQCKVRSIGENQQPKIKIEIRLADIMKCVVQRIGI